ncbi:MAG TPA: hypothetical protein VIH76_20090 [Candidatus Acidoferrales bacterium]
MGIVKAPQAHQEKEIFVVPRLQAGRRIVGENDDAKTTQPVAIKIPEFSSAASPEQYHGREITIIFE